MSVKTVDNITSMMRAHRGKKNPKATQRPFGNEQKFVLPRSTPSTQPKKLTSQHKAKKKSAESIEGKRDQLKQIKWSVKI